MKEERLSDCNEMNSFKIWLLLRNIIKYTDIDWYWLILTDIDWLFKGVKQSNLANTQSLTNTTNELQDIDPETILDVTYQLFDSSETCFHCSMNERDDELVIPKIGGNL